MRVFKNKQARGIAFLGAAAAGLALGGLIAPEAGADTIHLLDGRKIEGVVDQRQSDAARVFIRTTTGVIPIARTKIQKIDIRENVTPEETAGDLAMQGGDPDRAVESYRRALRNQPENEELQTKVREITKIIEDREAKKFETDFARIDEALKARRFDDAIEQGQALLKKATAGAAETLTRQRIGTAWLGKARDFRNTVSYPRAEESYRKAAEVDPAGPAAYLELAEMIAGYPAREKEAFELYTKGIELALENPDLVPADELIRHRYTCANLYLKGGNPREAAKLLWLVVQTDANRKYPRAFELILQGYTSILPSLVEENEENAEAVKVLDEIASKKVGDGRAQLLLGRVYYEREQFDKAAPPLAEAVAALGANSTEIADARIFLAISYRKLGQADPAAEQLKTLLETQPGRYDALCELGEIYLDKLQYARALEQFETAKRAESSSYRAYLGAARVYRETKRFPEAVQQFEKLIALKDDNADYLYEKGLTFSAMAKYEEARDNFEKALELLKKAETEKKETKFAARPGKILTQIGHTNFGKSSFYQAIEDYDKALAIDPKEAEALEGKGKAYRELGQLDKAEDFFKQAVDADPNSPTFILSLGVLYHKYKKDLPSALKYYTDYFQKGGGDPQVKEWIRECGGEVPA